MSSDPPNSDPPRITEQLGPLGGPSYIYRGVVIDANAQGTMFRVTWPNMDADDWEGSTDLDHVCRQIDQWLTRHHPPEVGG